MVSESFCDNYTVQAQQKLEKTWCLLNSGIQYIPAGSVLQVVESNFGSVECVPLEKHAAVASYFEAKVKFESPMMPGHYKMVL